MQSQSNECEIGSDIAAVGDKNNQVVLAKYQAAQNKQSPKKEDKFKNKRMHVGAKRSIVRYAISDT